jgi:hypothetical protein
MIDFDRAVWRKSTRTQQSGQCVEVAAVESKVAVRDSKDPSGPTLVFTSENFARFLIGLVDGDFSRPA